MKVTLTDCDDDCVATETTTGVGWSSTYVPVDPTTQETLPPVKLKVEGITAQLTPEVPPIITEISEAFVPKNPPFNTRTVVPAMIP